MKYLVTIEWTVSFNLHTFCMGKAIIVYFLTLKGRKFHSKHVNFVQKLGKLVVTMLTLKNLNIPAEIFSFLTISCSHTYLFVSILQRQSLCLERHLFECQVFFFSLGRLAWLWLLRVINEPKITWIRPWIFYLFMSKNFFALDFLPLFVMITSRIFSELFAFWSHANFHPVGMVLGIQTHFLNKNPATTFKSKNY